MGNKGEKKEKQGQGIPASSVDNQQPDFSYYDKRGKELADRRNTIAARLGEAYNQQQTINTEQEDVLGRFIRKPVQQFDEAKRLRRVAIAQALGELVGKIGEGIVAFGKGGEGYVTAPHGLYNKTIERMQALREKGVAAQDEYDKLMATIKQKRYDNAAANNKAYIERLQGQLDDTEKQIVANENARVKRQEALEDYAKKRADEEADATTKHQNAKEIAGIRGSYQIQAAKQRGENAKVGKLTADGARLMGVLFPTNTSTSTITDAFGDTKTTTTTRDGWTAAQEKMWAEMMNDLAEVGVSPVSLQDAIARNPKLANKDTEAWADLYEKVMEKYRANE